MGEVYRARDSRLGRDVAIKVLPQHLSDDPDLKARFEREARAISALNDPHICHLYDIGSQDGQDYLVMELLAGETLAARLQRGAIPLKQVLEFGMQIAGALGKAHKHGIVHRDLKPGNIMLTEAGAKLMDFGLAKGATARKTAAAPAFSATISESGSPLTASGTVVGTIQYMSPEQIEGKEADTRSDIFALGAVLYEMVTGKRAFHGKSQISIAGAILEQEPEPISVAKPMSPAALDFVVRTCLAKNPDERFQTAHDVKLQLQWLVLAGSQPGGKTPAVPRRRKLKWLAFAVTLVLVAAAGLWAAWPTPAPSIVNASQVTDDGNQKTGVYMTGTVPSPAVTDGSRLYFAESLASGFPLMQVSVNGGETAPVSTPFPNPAPADISANGSEILILPFVATETAEQLWSLPVPAGSPRRIGNVTGQDAAWAPDGTHIIYASVHDIFMCKVDGSDCKKLVTAPGMPAWMRWSPDGRRLRFTSYDSKTVSSSLWEVAADGSNLHRLLPDWNAGSTCCGTWTANGKYFVFQATHNERSDLWLLREGAWLRKPSLTQLTAGPLSFVSPVPGREGSRLYVIGARSRGELVRYDQKSRQFLPFLGGISADGVAFSKDGKQIAYTQYPQETLWRAKADGTGKMQLTFAPMRAFYPHWSPDGAKLVFSAFTPGSPSRIYSVPASGGTPEPVTSADNNAALPDWSPTGEAIVYGGLPGFMTIDSTAQPLRILDLKTGQSSPVPGSDGMICARWSPDGRFLAALTNASDKTMLFDFARKQWRVIANLPTVCPVWASNSQYLYCLEVNVSAAHLFRVRMSDGKLESIEDLQNFRGTQEPVIGDLWLGLAPGDSPLLLRDRGSEEIYALDWRLP